MGSSRKSATLRERAQQWMDENPQMMGLFRRFAREKMALGRAFGIGALAERVRWECASYGGEPPKINNSFRAYIVRALVAEMPEMFRFIETRVTPAANRPAKAFSPAPRVDPLTEELMDF